MSLYRILIHGSLALSVLGATVASGNVAANAAAAPYSVTSAGVTLTDGSTFPANGHVNYRTTLRSVGVHFDPNNNQPGGAFIGKTFLPIDLAPGECIVWVQYGSTNYHYGEGGEPPVCKPTTDGSSTPTPSTPPKSDDTSKSDSNPKSRGVPISNSTPNPVTAPVANGTPEPDNVPLVSGTPRSNNAPLVRSAPTRKSVPMAKRAPSAVSAPTDQSNNGTAFSPQSPTMKGLNVAVSSADRAIAPGIDLPFTGLGVMLPVVVLAAALLAFGVVFMKVNGAGRPGRRVARHLPGPPHDPGLRHRVGSRPGPVPSLAGSALKGAQFPAKRRSLAATGRNRVAIGSVSVRAPELLGFTSKGDTPESAGEAMRSLPKARNRSRRG
ncbi:hypothetical protein O159_18190 [Leifsonia xyli subsp. cynodontis DSM 46306]|uniref:Uncharacterized protein n=1 Tax=Leifsonia xyli subsp. cynodontis DSM 46306 TaxID=1389489 RepID=U3P8P7_LEIXC|nr:hypothetical protein [Leifsonia xyli]AGW41849.1 hypothetical protein O159_18190 [Leifsonia xyli subsp. cynodontis DSM 46306]